MLHLERGAEEAKRMILDTPSMSKFSDWRKDKNDTRPRDTKLLLPGDRVREKQRKQAAAAKWFPNGYGLTKGSRSVIEEIGDVDDDEENYGEFQGMVENGTSEEERSRLRDAISKAGYIAEETKRVVDEIERGNLGRKEKHKILWHVQQAGTNVDSEGSSRSWFDEYFCDRTMPGKQR